MTRRWTPWIRVAELVANGFANVSRLPGAYKIATRKNLPRLRDNDADGLLYCGPSGDLMWRIRAFYSCITNEKESHVARRCSTLVSVYRFADPYTLWASWCETETVDEAARAKSEVLCKYMDKHCELPPFNYSVDRKFMEEYGWKLTKRR